MSAKKSKKNKTTASSVCRVNKNANYTVMSNYHLRSTNLSLKAIGLLSKVLSLPENWDYSISGLTAICKEKETAIKAALDELKHWGYLVVTKLMPNETNSGRIEYVYDFYEYSEKDTPDADQNDDDTYDEDGDVSTISVKKSPQGAEKQGIEKQEVENQPLEILGVEILEVENHTLNKYKEEQNTEEQNTERKSKESLQDVMDDSVLLSSYPSLREAVTGYIEMRKTMKKPLTPRALRMALQKAIEYGQGDAERIQAVIDQSTMNGWQGIFPLKEDKKPDFFHTQSPRPSSNPFSEMLKQEGYV